MQFSTKNLLKGRSSVDQKMYEKVKRRMDRYKKGGSIWRRREEDKGEGRNMTECGRT